MLKFVTYTMNWNKYWAFEGKLILNKGTFTMICNVLIIPHKSCNDPDLYPIKNKNSYKIIYTAKFPYMTTFILDLRVLPAAPNAAAVAVFVSQRSI